MTTTIDIPDDKLRDAMRLFGATSPQDAIVKAIDYCIERKRPMQRELVQFLGTFEDLITPEELDSMRSMD